MGLAVADGAVGRRRGDVVARRLARWSDHSAVLVTNRNLDSVARRSRGRLRVPAPANAIAGGPWRDRPRLRSHGVVFPRNDTAARRVAAGAGRSGRSRGSSSARRSASEVCPHSVACRDQSGSSSGTWSASMAWCVGRARTGRMGTTSSMIPARTSDGCSTIRRSRIPTISTGRTPQSPRRHRLGRLGQDGPGGGRWSSGSTTWRRGRASPCSLERSFCCARHESQSR